MPLLDSNLLLCNGEKFDMRLLTLQSCNHNKFFVTWHRMRCTLSKAAPAGYPRYRLIILSIEPSNDLYFLQASSRGYSPLELLAVAAFERQLALQEESPRVISHHLGISKRLFCPFFALTISRPLILHHVWIFFWMVKITGVNKWLLQQMVIILFAF